MKIGILTYHRSHNYGALLQAIALHKKITDLGHETFFVDYWPQYHKDMYRIIDTNFLKDNSFVKNIKYLIRNTVIFPFKYGRYRKFKDFIKINIEKCCVDQGTHLDLIVCGSDQIWRKQKGMNNKFNPTYFGGGGETNATKYISYAASMGNINVNEKDREDLLFLLNNLSAISVREDELKELLKSLNFKDVKAVIDPTLLLTRSEWEDIANVSPMDNKEKYLLFYDLMSNSFNIKGVKEYAKKRGLKLKILKGSADYSSYGLNAMTIKDPFEMIQLIANAEEVLTSSYHGLVFSIIFGKPVAASFSNNAKRAESLLKLLNMENNILKPLAEDIVIKDIDYDIVDSLLCHLREDSINWIETTLKSSF